MRPLKKILIFTVGCLLITASALAQVYMKKNPDGSVTYTDTPEQGAEKVNLKELNVLKPKSTQEKPQEGQVPDSDLLDQFAKPPVEAPSPEGKSVPIPGKEQRVAYASLKITSLQDQQTLQNPVTVPVILSVTPALQAGLGDYYVLYINGAEFCQQDPSKSYKSCQQSTSGSFSIPREEMPRGTYTLSGAVKDKEGSTQITSTPITIYVKYKTIAVEVKPLPLNSPPSVQLLKLRNANANT